MYFLEISSVNAMLKERQKERYDIGSRRNTYNMMHLPGVLSSHYSMKAAHCKFVLDGLII